MLRAICAWTASTSSMRRGGLAMLTRKTREATRTTIQPRRGPRRLVSSAVLRRTPTRSSIASSRSIEPSNPISDTRGSLSAPSVRSPVASRQANGITRWPRRPPATTYPKVRGEGPPGATHEWGHRSQFSAAADTERGNLSFIRRRSTYLEFDPRSLNLSGRLAAKSTIR